MAPDQALCLTSFRRNYLKDHFVTNKMKKRAWAKCHKHFTSVIYWQSKIHLVAGQPKAWLNTAGSALAQWWSARLFITRLRVQILPLLGTGTIVRISFITLALKKLTCQLQAPWSLVRSCDKKWSFSVQRISIKVNGATTVSIMTFSIMTLSIMRLFVTLSIKDTQHNNILHLVPLC